MDDRWSHLLEFDNDFLLSPKNLEKYAAAVYQAGAPLDGVWGFIDCTIRAICRPSKWQRAAYSGHKKFHALKFQALMLPNGLFGHLFGPWESRRGDLILLEESKLLQTCAENAVRVGTDNNTPDLQRYLQIFGDPAYGNTWQIISPFAGPGERTAEEKRWNEKMASVRIEVEHGFGIVSNNFPFLNAGWKMHVYGSPVGRYYRAGVLFTNTITCLHYNQVSEYFDCKPPNLSACALIESRPLRSRLRRIELSGGRVLVHCTQVELFVVELKVFSYAIAEVRGRDVRWRP